MKLRWWSEDYVRVVKWNEVNVMEKYECNNSCQYAYKCCYGLVYSWLKFSLIVIFIKCICIVFIVCNVSLNVWAVLCAVLCCAVLFYAMLSACCIKSLLHGKTPFAVKINNNNNTYYWAEGDWRNNQYKRECTNTHKLPSDSDRVTDEQYPNSFYGMNPKYPWTERGERTPWSEFASELYHRATAACRRSDCQLLRVEGAKWAAWRIPTAVFSVF
jgi:hypothetical protein